MGLLKRSEIQTEQMCIDADCYKLLFYVNGERIEEESIDPRTTLATYLRDKLRLTGTKIGCNEGGCGACTVMLSEQNPLNKQIRHYSVNACLTPLCSVFGKAVTTVEGVGNTRKLHPIQERLAKAHGTQCGFCSPGFVMAMYTLLRNNPIPSDKEVNEAIQGNLCRCTGYRPILEAFHSFAKKRVHNGDIEDCVVANRSCCKLRQQNGLECNRKKLTQLSQFDENFKYDPQQELIFPPALMSASLSDRSFCMTKNGITWFQPVSLTGLLALKAQYPKAKIVCGNTELGVELKFQFTQVSTYINSKQVPDFLDCFLDEQKGAFVGAAVSLSEMNKMLTLFAGRIPENKSGVFRSVQKMLHWFAGKHVRDVASFAGNLVTASPISDLNPIWMAANASVVLLSAFGGERIINVDEKFFVEYRRTIIRDDEVVKGIWIPFTEQDEYFDVQKQAQRREDDIAIVNAAFFVQVEPYTYEVLNARIAYGGMAPITKFARRTSKAIVGKTWNRDLLELAFDKLSEELAVPPGAPGGMERYRQALAQSFFFKFFMHVDQQMKVHKLSIREAENCDDNCAKYTSTQFYQDVPYDQPFNDPVGRPILHQSAIRQVTGEALYCDDLDVPGALHLAFVLSSIACGELVAVDTSAALTVPGVVAYIDSHDVRDGYLIGGDTPVFVERKITYFGQPIGAIVADDHETARRAAHLVKITCTSQKAIVTMEEAEIEGSFLTDRLFQVHSSLLTGQSVTEFDWSKYDKVVCGSIRSGAQEHFYLETHQCLVIPEECDEISVVSSTQNVNEVQMSVSDALGVPQHKVTVRVRRIGGGFGGKAHCSSLFAVPTAIAAVKLRKPVKCSMERYDDMVMSGTRHPFKCDYKMAIRSDGMFENVEWKLTSNCGHTADMSIGVMNRAMVHADSVYRWPNADIYGRVCKTNLASNTAFRGFGAPQAMFATETMLKQVAEEYGFDVNEIREKNMYNEEDDCTPFGTHLHQCNIRRCWSECFLLSDYSKRLQAVSEFNRANEYRKRGIYMVPTKFGVGFSVRHCNQAGALVNIYNDGSVLIAHGGMEMGQGLYTKMMQVTARCLGIDVSLVHIHDTTTATIPNASSTAASSGSDLNGRAIIDACAKLNERLQPIKESNPEGTWRDWIQKAYMERIPLSASGFATIRHDPVDFTTGKGAELFEYFVYGVACSEVEIDCLTGDHQFLRADIVMDVGDSLNPALDIGQIEGAFLQGYGLFTMEEVKIGPNGTRRTRGPGTYKIPSPDDTPHIFNVKFLKGSANKVGVFSSKGLGEPPLFLGSSAFFAIREAIRAFRIEHGKTDYFRMDSPATAENIRLLCEDAILEKIAPLPDRSTFEPWTVVL